jgi:hypothetical protein
MTEDGWVYFCRICGEYKPESEFYKRKKTPFKTDSRCKIHYTKKEKGETSEMDYIKFLPLKEQDFIETQKVLQLLGYKVGENEEPVYIQFNKKYNL